MLSLNIDANGSYPPFNQAVMMDAMVQSCVECERPDDLFTCVAG